MLFKTVALNQMLIIQDINDMVPAGNKRKGQEMHSKEEFETLIRERYQEIIALEKLTGEAKELQDELQKIYEKIDLYQNALDASIDISEVTSKNNPMVVIGGERSMILIRRMLEAGIENITLRGNKKDDVARLDVRVNEELELWDKQESDSQRQDWYETKDNWTGQLLSEIKGQEPQLNKDTYQKACAEAKEQLSTFIQAYEDMMVFKRSSASAYGKMKAIEAIKEETIEGQAPPLQAVEMSLFPLTHAVRVPSEEGEDRPQGCCSIQ